MIKIETQSNNPSQAKEGITRRDFLQKGLLAVLAILGAEIVGSSVISLWPKPQPSTANNKILVGTISDFPVGSVTHFPDGGFFLSHVDAGFLALRQVCTHLGCIVPWKPDEQSEDKLASAGRFNCPCHGSIFDRYGQVVRSPATRPLDLFPISLNGDKLTVDTGVVIRRETYQESQVLKV